MLMHVHMRCAHVLAIGSRLPVTRMELDCHSIWAYRRCPDGKGVLMCALGPAGEPGLLGLRRVRGLAARSGRAGEGLGDGEPLTRDRAVGLDRHVVAMPPLGYDEAKQRRSQVKRLRRSADD